MPHHCYPSFSYIFLNVFLSTFHPFHCLFIVEIQICHQTYLHVLPVLRYAVVLFEFTTCQSSGLVLLLMNILHWQLFFCSMLYLCLYLHQINVFFIYFSIKLISSTLLMNTSYSLLIYYFHILLYRDCPYYFQNSLPLICLQICTHRYMCVMQPIGHIVIVSKHEEFIEELLNAGIFCYVP